MSKINYHTFDLVYENENHKELGVLKKFNCDFDVADTMDFQIEVGMNNNVLKGGYYWFIEDTEFGGRIDKYNVNTDTSIITYKGRSIRGLLTSKIIEPTSGQDYKTVKGNLAEVVKSLIHDAGYDNLFVVEPFDIEVSYKFNRYVSVYSGMEDVCKINGLVPCFRYDVDGKCHISFTEPTDYSDDNEFGEDNINFNIEKSYSSVNHLICLGKGELKDRQVVHLYVNKNGVIGSNQTLFGEDEITEVYDYSSAENITELRKAGVERLKEILNTDNFTVTMIDGNLKIGDIIGGIERVTNTYVKSEIINAIATIEEENISVQYIVGENAVGKSAKSRNQNEKNIIDNDNIQSSIAKGVSNEEIIKLLEKEKADKATTISGYGITDAYIKDGIIVLGGNSITPITDLTGYVTEQWIYDSGYITGITKEMVTEALGYTPPESDSWRPLGTTANTACAGNDARLSNARPAADVYAWAKAKTKPKYTYSEVGAAAETHTHTKSEIADFPTELSEFTNDTKYITNMTPILYIGSATTNGYIDYYYNKNRTRMTANTALASPTTVRLPATGGTLALASSDVRLKDNVNDSVTNAIELIMKIKMRQFDWNGNQQNGYLMNTHQEIGFIADELEQLDKRLVIGGGFDEDGDINIKTVDTFYLLGYVVKAIQEMVNILI